MKNLTNHRKEKRFQECNWIEKLWRYRWYLALPFMYIWNKFYMGPIPGHKWDEEKQEHVEVPPLYPDGKLVWKITLGLVQTKMHWYYTSEEVFERLHDKLNKKTKLIK